jgi:hypothetical protein
MTLQIYENSPTPSQNLSFPLLTVLSFVNTSHNIPLQSGQSCHLYAANFQAPAFNYSAACHRPNKPGISIPTLLAVLPLKNLHELKDKKNCKQLLCHSAPTNKTQTFKPRQNLLPSFDGVGGRVGGSTASSSHTTTNPSIPPIGVTSRGSARGTSCPRTRTSIRVRILHSSS